MTAIAGENRVSPAVFQETQHLSPATQTTNTHTHVHPTPPTCSLQVLKRLPRLAKIDSEMVTDQDREAAAKL